MNPLPLNPPHNLLNQKAVFNRSVRLWMTFLVASVLIWGQWCQVSMGVGIERLESSVEQVHGGCPSEASSANDECDSCLDELLSDSRSGLDNNGDASEASVDLALHDWFDDAVARYWRYR